MLYISRVFIVYIWIGTPLEYFFIFNLLLVIKEKSASSYWT